MAPTPTWSLTTHLLSLDRAAYEAATKHPFLKAAGEGRINTSILGRWLANDRLYIHDYIKAAGRTLALIYLPPMTGAPGADEGAVFPETQLVDWLIQSLAALRREERLFIKVARSYGISIDLRLGVETKMPGQDVRAVVPECEKLPGLVLFERLFGSVSPLPAAADDTGELPAPIIPWLEAAVVFWGTEKVYSEAWAWARSHQGEGGGGGGAAAALLSRQDADGGALREELIPNWASEGFVDFVQQLADIIDSVVSAVVDELGEGVKSALAGRAEVVWRELLAAERAFWPDV